MNVLRATEDFKEAKDVRKAKFAKPLDIKMKAEELDMYARTYVPPYRLPVVDRLKKSQIMGNKYEHFATMTSEENS